jgi:hypothetical protein
MAEEECWLKLCIEHLGLYYKRSPEPTEACPPTAAQLWDTVTSDDLKLDLEVS